MNLRVVGLETDDDPVVWQCGKTLPDGRLLHYYMTRSVELGLLNAFGRGWLDAHIAEKESEVSKWGVN